VTIVTRTVQEMEVMPTAILQHDAGDGGKAAATKAEAVAIQAHPKSQVRRKWRGGCAALIEQRQDREEAHQRQLLLQQQLRAAELKEVSDLRELLARTSSPAPQSAAAPWLGVQMGIGAADCLRKLDDGQNLSIAEQRRRRVAEDLRFQRSDPKPLWGVDAHPPAWDSRAVTHYDESQAWGLKASMGLKERQGHGRAAGGAHLTVMAARGCSGSGAKQAAAEEREQDEQDEQERERRLERVTRIQSRIESLNIVSPHPSGKLSELLGRL